jgi:pimeloyl-ACP methyl ester carboxylesterase
VTVVSRVVEVDGVPMSALLAEAAEPRAVVVALHGGATTSRYFDCPGRPDLSLLRTGAELGYTVLALDRPGYGSSAAHADRIAPAARRVDLAHAAVAQLLADRPRGAGLFLMAHSIGSELALRMAADERGADLLGLELAGTGRHHHDVAVDILNQRHTTTQPRKTAGLQGLIWQPEHLYPAEVVGGASIGSRGPAYEVTVVDGWATRDFARLAGQVRIPVHFSLGEHEMVWRNGPEALADIAAMFTAAPRVVVAQQASAGHNVSLGLTARAYHLKIFSFLEECVVDAARRQPEGVMR